MIKKIFALTIGICFLFSATFAWSWGGFSQKRASRGTAYKTTISETQKTDTKEWSWFDLFKNIGRGWDSKTEIDDPKKNADEGKNENKDENENEYDEDNENENEYDEDNENENEYDEDNESESEYDEDEVSNSAFEIKGKSGSQYADTLKEVVEKVSEGDTIILQKDIENVEDIEINKNIILNLQSYTINTTKTITINEGVVVDITGIGTIMTNEKVILFNNKGTLNLGEVKLQNALSHVIANYNVVNINGSMLESNAENLSTLFNSTTSIATINSGTIIGTKGAAISNRGKLIIEDGVITGKTYGIYTKLEYKDTIDIKINGGKITGQTTHGLLNCGVAKITGGTIEFTGEKVIATIGNKGILEISDNARIINLVGAGISTYENGTIKVSGGAIEGNTYGIYCGKNAVGMIEISGGEIKAKTKNGVLAYGKLNITGGRVLGEAMQGILNYSELIIDGDAQITSFASHGIANYSVLSINGGEIFSGAEEQGYAGVKNYTGGSIKMSGGMVSSWNGHGITNSSDDTTMATVEITGGMVSGNMSNQFPDQVGIYNRGASTVIIGEDNDEVYVNPPVIMGGTSNISSGKIVFDEGIMDKP